MKPVIYPVIVLSALLIACEQGPAEKAGEKLDDMAGSVEDSMEEAGDAMRDTANRIEDKCEEATGENC